MSRQPLQVLVIPFMKTGGKYQYAALKRSDMRYWQFIAGGGEGQDAPLEAAKREAFEEAGISQSNKYIPLLSMASIVAEHLHFCWGEDVWMAVERSFGVEVTDEHLSLSHEHTEYKWFSYEDALKQLKWDSNKNALWELNYRLTEGKMDDSKNKAMIEKYVKL